MAWQEEMYAELGKFFGLPEGAVVTHVIEDSEHQSTGYCETCYYSWFENVVRFNWVDADGIAHNDSYEGRLIDFIRAASDGVA